MLEDDCKPDMEFWKAMKSKMKTIKIFSTPTALNLEENDCIFFEQITKFDFFFRKRILLNM